MKSRGYFLGIGAVVLLSSPFALESCGSDDGPAAASAPDGSISPLPDSSADATDAADAADAARNPCSPGGFCPSPLPIQRPVLAISGPSIDNVWAVGSDAVVKWNGTFWDVAYQTAEPQGSDMLHGVWTNDGNDVWALGNQLVVRIANSNYRELAIPQVYLDSTYVAGWLTPDSAALWVATNQTADAPSQITRFHESPPGTMVSETWNPTTEAAWTGIWGFTANDVYAAGTGAGRAVIAHYDGTSWTVIPYSTMNGFRSLHGTPPAATPKQLWLGSGDVATEDLLFTVASDGTLGAPAVVPLPAAGLCSGGRDSVSMSASNDGWVSNGCLVYRWDGTSLTEVTMSVDRLPFGTVLGAWAGSSGGAWLVGRSIDGDPDFPDRQVGFAALRAKGGGP